MKVTPENLSKELQFYLQDYLEDIEDYVKKEADSVSKLAINELRNISPMNKNSKRDRHYANGWETKTVKDHHRYSKKIWNKPDYRLTHLLEFGHASRSGGHVSAQPHIRPVEKKYRVEFTENLERDIKR